MRNLKNVPSNPKKKAQIYTAVDLFAGGGGLSVGLKKAGFQVVAAVELEAGPFETYKANHPEVHAFHQDIRTINSADLMKKSPTGKIDLVAACPPCQGFSSLTAKHKRKDPRNKLVNDLWRVINELKPQAIMMENVPGLSMKGKPLFTLFVNKLLNAGYNVNFDTLQVADYGVPQKRRRLVLLAGLGFKISLPEKTHDRVGIGGLPNWRTVRDALAHIEEEPVTLSEAKADGGPEAYDWHVIRDMSPLNIRRLKKAKPGKNWASIPKHLRPECHQDNTVGFSNVYGRMEWDEPSPTITGGCTTLSKGRFGHPEELRTISVYEAALLQTFPEDYHFSTEYMEHACDIIGNALPCQFAQIVAVQCVQALNSQAMPKHRLSKPHRDRL